ncbi:MAG: DNA-directed RNA polymerase subunit alpha [Candidatus Niyogibacteria bacterium]|nr:MAG: DNA-directed RNA polymerase subunit alpha [Candidatus Niyogibacteria bacterium]
MEVSIVLPSKPRIVSEESSDKGVYEIDGLYPGYGHTLGNSLRRILLSSLPGAAVTKVKIEGVAHEFSTIPGVKEDVIAILLNLKKLRFRMATDETQTVKLKTKGAKIIKAEDLDLPGQIEIANPDQIIATLTDKSAALEMELIVERGLGYVPRDVLQKEKAEVGEVVLDAVFTPIRRVNYEVENMRVGDRTDFNRLRLSIQTDGTIVPRLALEEAIKIMINQLKAIVGFKEPEEEIEKVADEQPKKEAELSESEVAGEDRNKVRIEDLDLSERITKALTEASIRTVGGLVRRTSRDLMSLEGIGEKALTEIKRAVGKLGLTLKD